MVFLKEVLNVDVRKVEYKHLFPNYINSRYNIECVYLDEVKVFFIYPKVAIDSLSVLKKHLEKIRQAEYVPIVVILSKITARERKQYISARIPFIVKGKQCYLPFLGTLLTERCDFKAKKIKKLTPSAQVLLFYFIYNKAKDMYINDVCNTFGFSAMTISRAVKELEELNLICSYKEGVKKIISTEFYPKDLFEQAKAYLISPIKRTQYILKEELNSSYVYAGDSALAMHSMLNEPAISCYATGDTEVLRNIKDEIIYDEKNQVEIQVWKYRPCIYKKMGIDVLSVVMTYQHSHDERIAGALEEMLDILWSKLYG